MSCNLGFNRILFADLSCIERPETKFSRIPLRKAGQLYMLSPLLGNGGMAPAMFRLPIGKLWDNRKKPFFTVEGEIPVMQIFLWKLISVNIRRR